MSHMFAEQCFPAVCPAICPAVPCHVPCRALPCPAVCPAVLCRVPCRALRVQTLDTANKRSGKSGGGGGGGEGGPAGSLRPQAATAQGQAGGKGTGKVANPKKKAIPDGETGWLTGWLAGWLGQGQQGLVEWMKERGYTSLAEFRGAMNLRRCPAPGDHERASYIKVLQSWRV